MRLLVIRTSAMGDVALTLPVLKDMSEQFPEVRMTLLTREAFGPFFTSFKNIDLFKPDFQKRHGGFAGLFRLFLDLKRGGHIDYVIDLHDVIRSIVLRLLFRISGVPVRKIDKGRSQKMDLVSGREKRQLKHTVERYRDVFVEAGFDLKSSVGKWLSSGPGDFSSALMKTGFSDGMNIGVAPFAMHPLKVWPEEYMVKLLKMIAERSSAKFWLFGGKDEAEALESFQKQTPGAMSLAGKLSLGEEIAIISKLDFMISMDSSNMHMAALAGTKVISIWGATDPLAGFGAWAQPEEYSLRIPESELTCRPCTVFGKGECRRRDHACMEWLTPVRIMNKLIELKFI